MLLVVDNASRQYRLDLNTVNALESASLTVSRGEFLALSGPSGSGKSTLLNLIGCIDKPTSGKIYLDGIDTSGLSSAELATLRRTRIGFVFQTFNLIPVLTAWENVAFPLLLQGISREESRDRVSDALDSVGLRHRAGHRPDLLSGGERQRVAVARAIVHRPALVLADEPTANLDTRNATQLIDLMRELNLMHQLTFIFSTHDQRLLEHAARIVEMRDGSILRSPLACGLADGPAEGNAAALANGPTGLLKGVHHVEVPSLSL